MLNRIVGLLAILLLPNVLNVVLAEEHLTQEMETQKNISSNLIKLSEDLLMAVRYEEATDTLLAALEDVDYNLLLTELDSDTKKVAFWVNMYNASYQILYKDLGLRPDGIFKKKAITIASIPFSLDDMEHGILRKYRNKFSLGYMAKLFPGKHIKQLAVNEIDWRIHFALNCGAKSCPPIAFYDVENLETQLDLATASFLSQETVVNEEGKVLEVTKIMSWFRADFGGKDGIREIVGKVFKRDFNGYKISYQEYDWTAKLDYFVE